MPIAAVQALVRSILDGVEGGNYPPAVASIQPPIPGSAGSAPQIFVWGAAGTDERATFPRSVAGNRRLSHQVEIVVVATQRPNEEDADYRFPALVDAVMQTLRLVEMPIEDVVDPITGQVSRIPNFAEKMVWHYFDVEGVPGGNQRAVIYHAQITVGIEEWISG